MSDLNRVLLVGNLTRDPVLSKTNGGIEVVDFGMAVNRRYTNKNGDKHEEVCYVDCSAFGGQASVINKYFKKGRPIYVEGRLKFDQWETEGKKRNKLRIIAENFRFMNYQSPTDTDNNTADNADDNSFSISENFDSLD